MQHAHSSGMGNSAFKTGIIKTSITLSTRCSNMRISVLAFAYFHNAGKIILIKRAESTNALVALTIITAPREPAAIAEKYQNTTFQMQCLENECKSQDA